MNTQNISESEELKKSIVRLLNARAFTLLPQINTSFFKREQPKREYECKKNTVARKPRNWKRN